MALNLLILVSEKNWNYVRKRLHPQFLSLGYACWQIQLHWNEELSRSLHAFVQCHEANLHYLPSKTSWFKLFKAVTVSNATGDHPSYVSGMCNKAEIVTRPAHTTKFAIGTEFSLGCRCRSSGTGLIHWIKNGDTVSPVRGHLSLDNRWLNISGSSFADSGNYTCYVTIDKLGTAKSEKLEIWGRGLRFPNFFAFQRKAPSRYEFESSRFSSPEC